MRVTVGGWWRDTLGSPLAGRIGGIHFSGCDMPATGGDMLDRCDGPWRKQATNFVLCPEFKRRDAASTITTKRHNRLRPACRQAGLARRLSFVDATSRRVRRCHSLPAKPVATPCESFFANLFAKFLSGTYPNDWRWIIF